MSTDNRNLDAARFGPEIAAFWQAFLTATGRPADTPCYDCFAFGYGKALQDELAALVLAGQKRATSSSVPVYEAEGEPLPQPGELSIVLDGDGVPRCVIQTQAVTILAFREVTWDLCRREGEDESLESWQAGHVRFFTQDMEGAGLEFTWDMPMVFEDFEMVYRL